MSTSARRHRRWASAALAAVLLVFGATPAIAANGVLDRVAALIPADQELQLEMELNGKATGLVGSFRRSAEGVFRTPAKDLEEAGLDVRWLATDGDGMVRLDRVPGLSFTYDEAQQTIRLQAAPRALATVRVDAGRAADPGEYSRPATAAVFNYALYASLGRGKETQGPRFEGVSGSFEARVSGRFGAVSHGVTGLATAGGEVSAVRLDTAWTHENPKKMLSFRAGDLVTGAPAWGRPVRLGGVQVARRFDLRPDLVTMPLPVISGTAQAPSSLDLYVNQVKALSTDIPAGPFEVTRPPVVYGGGTASVVLRDALGRETVTSLPFYASPQLLAPGLSDFSAELGWTRRSFGGASWAYDRRLAGSGAYRLGLSPKLTLEARAESASRLALLGAGGVVGLGNYGVASVGAAVSQAGGRTGRLWDLALEAKRGPFSLSAGAQRANRDFHDLASWTAEPPKDDPFNRAVFQPARAVNRVHASAPLMFDAQLGVSYTDVRQADERVRALGLSLNRSTRRATTYVSLQRDLEQNETFRLQAGLTVPLRGERTLSTGVSGGSKGTSYAAEVSGQRDFGPDNLAVRLAATAGEVRQRELQASYSTGLGRLDGRLYDAAGKLGVSAEAAGSLVLVDGKSFLSRRVDGAFAVVDVGAPGVTVRHENRTAGRTGKRGLVLLPELTAYQPNRIEADPEALAIDAQLESSEALVTPLNRTGAMVRLQARSLADAAIVVFKLPDGSAVPVGSSGRLVDAGEAFTVGYDGEAYVHALGSKNQVSIELAEGGTCKASFTFKPTPGRQARIPDVVCRSLQYVRGVP